MTGQNSNTTESKKPFIFHDHICGMVPFRIAKDLDLNATQLRIYIFIAGLKFQMEDVYINNEDLCTQLGIKEDSKKLQKYIREMKKKGYLRREKREVTKNGKKFKAWCWDIGSSIIIQETESTKEVSQEDTFNDNNDEKGVSLGHLEGVSEGHLNKRKKIKENNTSESGDSPVTDLNDFVSQVVDVYHEKLPEMPQIKIITDEVKRAIKTLIKEWPKIKGMDLTLSNIARYFEGRRELTPWILEPYKTKQGNLKRSRLINLIRIDNVRKFYNGDYANG